MLYCVNASRVPTHSWGRCYLYIFWQGRAWYV